MKYAYGHTQNEIAPVQWNFVSSPWVARSVQMYCKHELTKANF